MFAKDKVTQSMIDAVKQVVETAPIKEPTPTGMRVYGSSYGNSAKAKQDQTKSSVDTLKGPKDKEMQEELKGNQDKIDANHNGKVDAQDFAILRGKKKVKEGREFAEKLLASINEKKDVVMPEDSVPAKNTDIADKSYLKDMGKKPTVKSDLKNLGRFLTGKKETNEEVTEAQLDEMINEVLSKDASAGEWIDDFVHSDNPKFAGKSKAERKKMALGAYYGQQKEEADANITTDELSGRTDGGKSNNFKSFKLKVKGDHTPEKDPGVEEPEETESRKSIKAKDAHVEVKPASIHTKEEVVSEAGMKRLATDAEEDKIERGAWSKEEPWKDSKETVTDKSGAKHTPMSRAKDLARSAFKKIKNETMMGKISN